MCCYDTKICLQNTPSKVLLYQEISFFKIGDLYFKVKYLEKLHLTMYTCYLHFKKYQRDDKCLVRMVEFVIIVEIYGTMESLVIMSCGCVEAGVVKVQGKTYGGGGAKILFI